MNIIWCAVVVFSVFSVVLSDSDAEHKVVETKDGKVRGVRKKTLLKEMDYYSFKGIPYAKSPTGDLRFKAPVPIDSWAPATKDAFEHGNTCVRLTQFFVDKEKQGEDCLFLNVYVPADAKPSDKLPVLAYIHGGAFQEGSANDDVYGPDFLLEKGVILVTFNYRLGIFGFLSLGTPEYSGNMALKDQQLALKWVHANIGHFDGDNKQVTLIGESAGGASTHFHLLSSESRKYFKYAAPMSGTTFNYWAFAKQNDQLDQAYKIADELGEPKKSFDELVEFLKTVPADKIVGYGSVLDLLKRTARGPYAPVMEKKDAIHPFIVDSPDKIYSKSKIDVGVMFSLCENEGITFYMKNLEEMYNYDGLHGNFTVKPPFDGANLAHDSPKFHKLMAEIREFYFKKANIDKNALNHYIAFISDFNFGYGIDKAARKHAAQTNEKTFLYRFSVDSKLTLSKRFNPEVHGVPGSGHGNELCYMFRCNGAQPLYDDILKTADSDEQSKVCLKTIENMTKMVTNFAKYGKPTHNGDPIKGLHPIQKDHVNFIDVTNDGLKLGVNPRHEANKLWARIEKETKE